MAFLNRSVSSIRTLWRVKDVVQNQTKCLLLRSQAPVSQRMCSESSSESTLEGLKKRHFPSNFEKKMLVWCKQYSKVEDVPESITLSSMSRAKDYFRVRFAALMVLSTMIASLFYVSSGKKAAARGESVAKMNLEWQQRNREALQAKKRKEAADAAAAEK